MSDMAPSAFSKAPSERSVTLENVPLTQIKPKLKRVMPIIITIIV